MCLLELPDEVLISCLTDWLDDIRDIGRLDIAICSSSFRSRYLKLLRYDSPGGGSLFLRKVYESSCTTKYHRYFKWITSRKVASTALTFPREMYRKDKRVLSNIGPHFGLLTSLTAMYLTDDTDLKRLGDYCPLLSELDISHSNHIHDAGLESLARGCSFLQCLNLGKCRNITNTGLSTLANCHFIRSLDLSYCRITDWGLAIIASNCPSLEWLDLSWISSGVSDAGIISIATGCIGLQCLFLKYCVNITDKGLAILAGRCKALRMLSIDSCHLITDKGLLAIGQGCTSLQELNIVRCDQISQRVVEYVCTIRTGVCISK